jgi:hypothetical protein
MTDRQEWDEEYGSEDDLADCQDEDGVYNLVVSPDHFMLKLCKCGHYYGRHKGRLSDPDNAGHCFDCDCQKYEEAPSKKENPKAVEAGENK